MIEDVEMNITDSSESNDSTESLLEINRLPTSCKIFIPKEYYHYEVNKDYIDDFIEFTTENRNITFRDITLKKFTILEMYLPRSSVKFFLNLGLSEENFATTRSVGNLLTKSTAVIATLFIISSISLVVLSRSDLQSTQSVLEKLEDEKESKTPKIPESSK